MGAKLVYEVANKTNDLAGDGTTTATLLTQSMIHKGLANVEKGTNPVIMKAGIKQRKEQDQTIEKYDDNAELEWKQQGMSDETLQ